MKRQEAPDLGAHFREQRRVQLREVMGELANGLIVYATTLGDVLALPDDRLAGLAARRIAAVSEALQKSARMLSEIDNDGRAGRAGSAPGLPVRRGEESQS